MAIETPTRTDRTGLKTGGSSFDKFAYHVFTYASPEVFPLKLGQGFTQVRFVESFSYVEGSNIPMLHRLHGAQAYNIPGAWVLYRPEGKVHAAYNPKVRANGRGLGAEHLSLGVTEKGFSSLEDYEKFREQFNLDHAEDAWALSELVHTVTSPAFREVFHGYYWPAGHTAFNW